MHPVPGLRFLPCLATNLAGLGSAGWGGGRICFGAVAERLIELFGGSFFHQSRDVRVGADGRFRRGMPEDRRQCLDIQPVFDAVGCEDMAQSVERDMFTLGAVEHVGEFAPATRGASRLGVVERGRKHPFGIHRFLIFFKDPDDRLRDLDGSDGCLRFRRADDIL